MAILVPVLQRPHRVKPLLDSIEAATPDALVVFLADPDDLPELEALDRERDHQRELRIWVNTEGGNYATKINRGVGLTTEPLVFTGADDLHFHAGWFEAALVRLTDGIGVVGTNDLIDRRSARREHATHFLMTREYAERPLIDGGRGPLFEGYDHSWSDNELVATAQARGAYTYAAESHVRHEHPMNGTAPDDEVYRKGRDQFHEDRRIFECRQALWAA